MPSIFTLEGPYLGTAASTAASTLPGSTLPLLTKETALGISIPRLLAIGAGAAVAGFLALRMLGPRTSRRGLRGPSMLQTIAREARTADEYARRVEAWNAAEAKPMPVAKLAKAYRKASPSTVAKLIRQAHETRVEGRERLWSKMSRGLRGRLDGYRVYYVLNVGGRVVRAPDEQEYEMKATAINRLKQYKRRGMTAWVEDENGFVPVPGAMRPNNLSKR